MTDRGKEPRVRLMLARTCSIFVACMWLSACLRNEPLPCGVQEACPDGLVCSDGACVEAPSCDGGACQVPVTRCPAKPPSDPSAVFAAVDLRCEYGEETCCGVTHPSQVCIADAGDSFACLFTDACLVRACCENDSDCAKGQVCEADREADLACVAGCRKDADCASTERCVQVQCFTLPCPALCMPRDDANMSTMHE